MEQENDRVLEGKILHETAYKRDKQKDIYINNTINIDRIDKEYVKEIKISSKMEKADKMQLYYYLYYLKQLGLNKKGLLNYVKEKRKEEIILTSEI